MNIHERRHPLYERYIDDWNFYMESYVGGDEYVNKYLATHRLENPEDFMRRKQRAYYLNYCAPIVSIPSDYIFKKEATRPTDENLTLIRENVDYKKTNIHEYMRKISSLSSIFGQIHILVDRVYPPEELQAGIKEGKTTKRDNMKFKPYATIILPQNLLDWSIDIASQSLNWILVYEEQFIDESWEEERNIVPVYKIWTKTQWISFDDENNQIASGNHNLGYVPLITHYHKDLDYNMVGESMLNGVAETNKAIFNWCSDIDEMIARQTFSQLICPSDGTDFNEEIDDTGKSSALRKVGSASVFTFPSESRHAPAFISPDTAQISIIWEMIKNHVIEMFRMSGLVSAKSSLIQLQQRTGKAQEFEFLDMAVFFANKAKQLEHTENQLNQCFYDWLDIKDNPERVHYPEKFDIVSSTEIVDLFTKVVLNAISGTLNKEMAKRLVYQVLPHAEDEVVRKIFDEIESNEVLEDPTILTLGKQADIQNPPANDAKTDINTENNNKKADIPKIENVAKEPVPNTKNPKRRAKINKKHE